MEQRTKHTGASYAGVAGRRYAETVDARPWNAHYERPAMVALLPALRNIRVLDVGCGSGWYAEHLLNQGATVTAFDLNADFVARTRQRVGDRAHVHQADLTRPLDFAADDEFDLVLCPLVLHYLENWEPALRELHRVLRPDGVLLFSTHHPFANWGSSRTDSYFVVERVEEQWDIGKVQFYRRPLRAISDALATSGFVIERIVEPQPTEAFRQIDAAGYATLVNHPGFLIIRSRKVTS